MNGWIFLAGAIALALVGQTLLKAGAGASDFVAQLFNWTSIVGLGAYGGSALLYMTALRSIPLSVALPSTAVSYVAAALIGHYGYGEPFGLVHGAGLAMIAVGVVVLATA